MVANMHTFGRQIGFMFGAIGLGFGNFEDVPVESPMAELQPHAPRA